MPASATTVPARNSSRNCRSFVPAVADPAIAAVVTAPMPATPPSEVEIDEDRRPPDAGERRGKQHSADQRRGGCRPEPLARTAKRREQRDIGNAQALTE